MDFRERYNKLNTEQKKAVDTIYGPVMVVAGPGTGKTELLSLRVANIIQQTDTLPENILCLTFTESGTEAMRLRLNDIIGKESYKVAIQTFHGFCNEVINIYSEYFYGTNDFSPASELNRYEIIRQIFDELEHDNILAKKMDGEYIFLRDVLNIISDLKRSGFSSDELLKILDENQPTIDKINDIFSPILSDRISNEVIAKLEPLIDKITVVKSPFPNLASLSQIFVNSLTDAIDQAKSTPKMSTKPITAWKSAWFEKNSKNKQILKDTNRQKKLREIAQIYETYLSRMSLAKKYDYDDMILKVTQALDFYPELRYNLQEKYQFIMVDEFQDTNLAQMRILHSLTSDDIDNSPNIMVVGDDDQAIYSFQGADVSNILNFKDNYPKYQSITLIENYRSTKEVLSGARNLIRQGGNRLEDLLHLDKTLNAHNEASSNTSIYEAKTIFDERQWLINSIKECINSGESPKDIAVITRNHKELSELLPYFADNHIAVSYEKSDNVLKMEPILLIEKIARAVIKMSHSKYDEADELISEIISHPAFKITPTDLWQISTSAYKAHKTWLEIIKDMPQLQGIFNWLVTLSAKSANTSLEEMLDIILGQNEIDGYTSPLMNYFFSNEKLGANPDDYVTYLEAIRTIREALNEYSEQNDLESFIDFINLNNQIKNTISLIQKPSNLDNAINLMTAHKSKGQEFGTVYITNAVDSIWGEKSRHGNNKISYPENLNIMSIGDSSDEKIRLFFVATTRAKQNLNISYSISDTKGKLTMRASFLTNSSLPTKEITPMSDVEYRMKSSELAWYQPIIRQNIKSIDEALRPMLENYKLSVTHLNNFIDIVSSGPEKFLLNNLLHFPKAKNPSAAYGTAIHATLQNAHNFILAKKSKQAIEDILIDFESNLKKQFLPESEYKKYFKKGTKALQIFLDNRYDRFNQSQQTELDFNNQSCMVNDAHITGKLDVVEIDKNSQTISVIDYKTGKSSKNWSGKTDYEKIKLHKYKQQLLFYKLLIENSRDYHRLNVGDLCMQFVEPNEDDEIMQLEATFSDEDIDRFAKLINVVWQKITSLDLPNTDNYEKTYKGVLQFEDDLIESL